MGDHLEKLIHMYKEYISITSTSSSNIRATKVTQEAARFSLLSLSFQVKLLHNITISLFFFAKVVLALADGLVHDAASKELVLSHTYATAAAEPYATT